MNRDGIPPRFRTLRDLVNLPPGMSSAFLIALLNKLKVQVSQAGNLCLFVHLTMDLLGLRNTAEKHLLQKWFARAKEPRRFVRKLKVGPQTWEYTSKTPFRFVSGGLLPILRIGTQRYIALTLRDLEPIVGWNLLIGSSESLAELLDIGSVVEREGREELLVLNTVKRICYCLQLPNSTVPTIGHYKKVLTKLKTDYTVASHAPLVGVYAPNQPDAIWVTAGWVEDSYITSPGFLLFTPERGELGIEFVQVVEWVIPAPLNELTFRSGELDEDTGELIDEPIGLFLFDKVVAEMSRPKPKLMPDVLYVQGMPLTGELIQNWIEQPDAKHPQGHPYAYQCCPALKVMLERYVKFLGVQNLFVHTTRNHWNIQFQGGKSFFLPDRMGLRYMAFLLENAGEPVWALEVAQLRRHEELRADEALVAQLKEEGLSIESGRGGKTEAARRAAADARRHLAEIDEELKGLAADLARAQRDHDEARIERIQWEIEEKAEERRAFQSHLHELGRDLPPMIADQNARAFDSVRKAINSALKAIARKNPELADHLDKAIRRGQQFIYDPDVPLKWHVERLR